MDILGEDTKLWLLTDYKLSEGPFHRRATCDSAALL